MIEAHHIAIVTRSIINTHALNNETAEGNEQILRRIQVLAGENNQKDYKYIEVSAISGGMQKFMFDTALRQICKDLKLPISKGANLHSPQRIWGTKVYRDFITQTKSLEKIYNSLLSCTMTDIGGIMALKKGGKQIKRKSVMQYGWAFSLTPDLKPSTHNRTRSMPVSNNLIDDQMIFTQETASGIYGTMSRIQLNRIGFNDYSHDYPDEVEGPEKSKVPIERIQRMKAVLYAVESSLTVPQGASVSTQLPHFTGIEGIICVSGIHNPPLAPSPINITYREDIEAMCQRNNKRFSDGQQYTYRFDNYIDLAGVIDEISQTFIPAKIRIRE
ncbi:MAG: DevR family CRISPR-associated autoregulator [Phototrophicaceae bacterium]